MMGFEAPAFIILAALPPAFIALEEISGKGRGMRLPLERWPEGGAPATPFLARVLLEASRVALALACVCLALVAAGPYRTDRKPVYPRDTGAVVFALDVSPSMAALDMDPSRFGTAISFIRRFLANSGGISVGLVVFGADAALVCPPTGDYGALAARLDSVMPGMLGDGTAVGLGLATAGYHLAQSRGKSRAVVLLTDGEDNSGSVSPDDAASAIGRIGRLVAVGLGTNGDVPISYSDPKTGERLSGSYRSTFDARSLESLAKRGGGEYCAASDAESLGAAFRRVVSYSPSPEPIGATTERTPFAPFLSALAVALMAVSFFVRRVAFGGIL